MKWTIILYKKEDESCPVRDFMRSLTPKMRAKALREIELLEEHGTDLGAPYTKAIQGKAYRGLYELRVKQASDITRIFYFLHDGNSFILLNGFTKKTDKTPVAELERAKKYKLDYERRVKDE